jgi:ribosomal-protein-alanine N-acetyltransferase
VSGPLHLGPGSTVPGWVETLERACFGEPWGPLGEGEHIWAVFPGAFARWRIVPAVEEGELLRIGVATGQRRTGQGRALLRHCQVELARYGIQVLHLEVRVSNAAARGLYEGEGWVFQGIRKSYYRNGEDACIYRRGD